MNFSLKKFLGKERQENAWLWVSNAGTWIEALAPFTWLTALFFQIMVFLTSNNPQLSPGHAWKSILCACPWHLWSTGMCRTHSLTYIACGLVSTASMIQNRWLIDWFTYNSTDFYKVFTNCMSTQIKSLVNFRKKFSLCKSDTIYGHGILLTFNLTLTDWHKIIKIMMCEKTSLWHTLKCSGKP